MKGGATNGGDSDGDERFPVLVLADFRELVLVRKDLVTGSLGETSGVGKETVDGVE